MVTGRWRRLGGVALAAGVLAGCSPAGPAQLAGTASQRGASLTPLPSAASSPAGRTATPADASSSARTPAQPITLAFGGDVHFMGVDGSRLAADPATALGPAAAILRRADFAMVNLETAVTTGGTPAPKKFVFRAPPSAFTALRDAGVDVVTMANNHGMDYGRTGLADSLAAAHAAHFPVVGIGRDAAQAYAPYRLTVKGQRLAVFGATQVLDDNLIDAWTAGPDKPGLASAKEQQQPQLVAAIRAARATADVVIVYLHWGQELNTCPLDRQRDLAEDLIDAGADVVVGSHAHVPLGGGWLNGRYVDYGLGNFVFYTGGGVTARSGVLELTLTGRTVRTARWLPATIEGGVPVPLTGAAAKEAVARWNGLRGCTGLSANR